MLRYQRNAGPFRRGRLVPHGSAGFRHRSEEAHRVAPYSGGPCLAIVARSPMGSVSRGPSAVEFDRILLTTTLFCAAFQNEPFSHQIGPVVPSIHGTVSRPDNFWMQIESAAPQSRLFGFDTANTPPKTAKAVNHVGVGLFGPYKCNRGMRLPRRRLGRVSGPDCLRQISKVHLVADACAWGNNGGSCKTLLTPFPEGN